MHRRKICFVQGKRAVWAGLFLGVLLSFPACVKPGVQPGGTGTPAPSPTGTVIPTPEQGTPTSEPVLTDTPAAPTGTPGVTSGITGWATSVPTPTGGAELTSEPVLEPTVSPDAFGSPTPEPTGLPEYDTLLQNGWQRTEDFFGSKEIFFSGKFDKTELLVMPGRYEYRYTASSDPEISFSVIGDEIVPIQQFLDELVGKAIECYIERETEKDYRYLYTDGVYTVEGRVYDCGTEELSRCMRVEFRKAGMEENITEGHEFYLREKGNAE